jgi:outer membrane protein assembly factor BamB
MRVTTSIAVALAAIALVIASPPPSGAATQRLWFSRIDGHIHRADFGDAVTVTPDGSTVIATGGVDSDYLTVAFDATTGKSRWRARYDGPDHHNDTPYRVAVSSDGSVAVVTGVSFEGASADYATVAYSAATGTQLWVARYDAGPAGHTDDAWGLAVSPDGSTVVVTGESTGTTSLDYATIAYSMSTGATLWSRRYDGPDHGEDDAYAVAYARGGSTVIVTGKSHGGHEPDFDDMTIAYDAKTGHTLWSQRESRAGAASDDVATDVTVTPDGATAVVSGRSSGQITAVAYDTATGAALWRRRLDGASTGGPGLVAASMTPDGATVAITGQVMNSSHGDYLTVAYDVASGQLRWERSYNGPGNDADSAASIAATPDNKAFVVTGASMGSTSGNDITTVAYDAANGSQLWVRRYNGPANGDDRGVSVAVAPNSSAAFVTGYSPAAGTSFLFNDFVTIAYPLP